MEINFFIVQFQKIFRPVSENTKINLNFMVAPCINNIRHYIVQLMHTNYEILRLLK